MNNLRTVFDRIYSGSLLLLACFPVLPLNLTGAIIIVWGISAILLFVIERPSIDKASLWKALPSALLYFAYLASVSYSEHSEEAWAVLSQKLSLLIFPVVALLTIHQRSSFETKAVLRLFASSVLALSLFGNLGVWIEGFIYPGLGQLQHGFSYLYRLTIEKMTGLHPTYMALFQLFSVLIFFDWYRSLRKENPRPWQLPALFAICGSLIAMNLLLAARIPLVAFVGAVIFLSFTQVKSWKNRLLKIVVPLLMLVGVTFLIPSMRSRLAEVVQTSWEPPSGSNHNSTNTRIGVLQCATQLISENPLLGVGAGDVQPELNACYESYDTDIYRGRNFNSHNEYLNVWLGSGVIGLLFFLLTLASGFYFYRQHWLSIAFGLLFAICCLTENLLDRQMGIVFFMLFHTLFLFANHSHSRS